MLEGVGVVEKKRKTDLTDQSIVRNNENLELGSIIQQE